MTKNMYLLTKAADIVFFVIVLMCASITVAAACSGEACEFSFAIKTGVSSTQGLSPQAVAEGRAGETRVAWVVPSHAPQALSRGNLVLVQDKREVFNGCTMDQMRSMKGSVCIDKAEKDIINNAPLTHIIVCKGTEIVCCLQDGHGKYTKCEAMGPMAPPKPEVVCSTLNSAKGVWTPDPKSIKANSDNKTCSQVYVCGPPLPKELSESQNKCTAFVSVSNKQVTMTGTCVPGKSPGTCTSCLGNPPNDPCTVSFRK